VKWIDADWMQITVDAGFWEWAKKKKKKKKGRDHGRDILGYFVYHIVTAHSLMVLYEVRDTNG